MYVRDLNLCRQHGVTNKNRNGKRNGNSSYKGMTEGRISGAELGKYGYIVKNRVSFNGKCREFSVQQPS